MREAPSHPIRYSPLRRAVVLTVLGGGIWWCLGNSGIAGESSQDAKAARKLDINAAERRELEGLPGITSHVVDRIIRNRPYRKLDELVTRKIVTRKQFAQIREFISVAK